MQCSEAHAMIKPFLANKLSMKDTRQFIAHVENCRECFDELEVSYMISAALNDDHEKDLKSYDLRGQLQEKLNEKKKRYRRLTTVLIVTSVLIILIAAGIFSGLIYMLF